MPMQGLVADARQRRTQPIRRIAMLRPIARLLGSLLIASLPLPALAHPLSPSLLQVEEIDGGAARVTWKTPVLRVPGSDLRPVLPSVCKPAGERRSRQEGSAWIDQWSVDCGGGLIGSTLRVDGIAASKADVLLRVTLLDGRSFRQVLTTEDPSFRVPEKQGRLEVARAYAALGFAHILSGLDHLLFVFGLILLVRDGRLLLWTITAFTFGHSVTLSAAVLGFVHVPTRPVEVLIAFSILLLASELARPQESPPTLMRRSPWIMAFGFGLLHGLGFAGALAAVGLPDGEIPLALFSFNVGIEIGQVLVVAAVLLGRGLLAPALVRLPARVAWVPSYVMGTLAAFWCFERLSAGF
jgi:hydrogenase/urease accessory protein HupE